MKAFQDYYADDVSHCYGCGRLNEHGLKVKSYWDGRASSAFAAKSWPCTFRKVGYPKPAGIRTRSHAIVEFDQTPSKRGFRK